MSEPDRAGRLDTDDYDLLTYGEAAARLAELLSVEQDTLSALLAQPDPDTTAVAQLEKRIALLQSSDARYRRQSLSAEAFTARFGFTPRDTETRGNP